jgi:hypothetical protein
VAQHKYACVVTVLSHAPYTIGEYKRRLKNIHELVHVTIETNRCCDDDTDTAGAPLTLAKDR